MAETARLPGPDRTRALSYVLDHPEVRTVPTLEEPLLTAGDVARLLAVPRSSVYDYARRKVDPMPSILIGRHRRFLRSDIENWVEQQRATG